LPQNTNPLSSDRPDNRATSDNDNDIDIDNDGISAGSLDTGTTAITTLSNLATDATLVVFHGD
jgi:hypothetical protein